MPKAKAGLPYRIVKLATDMFARDTGFSGPEIHRLFADHTDVLGPYTMGGGGASRWELFETGLNIPFRRRPTPLPARPLHLRRPEQVPEAVR
jgi:hypothetical protein